MFKPLFLFLYYFQLSLGACEMTNRLIAYKEVIGPFAHSEGPHWNAEDQSLYFVDITGKALHRYHPESDSHSFLQLNDTVNVVIPIKGEKSKFLLGYGLDLSILFWDWKTGKYSLEKLTSVDENKPNNRFNDGKADAEGRLWIGTMSKKQPAPGEAAFYRITADCETLKKDKILDSVSISNGLTWSLDNKLMYYIDTPMRKIELFDYNVKTGVASGRRTFFSFEKNNIKGFPDGMTIDREGNIWVACYDGGRVIEISPLGRLLRQIELPTDHTSSVAWGGKDLSTLYVTTMYAELDEKRRKEQPLAGYIFAITGLGTAGHSEGFKASSCFLKS